VAIKVSAAQFSERFEREAHAIAALNHSNICQIPEALVGLAVISVLYDYNWKEAERLFGMAMTRGPLSGGARMRYGHYLYCTGRPEAALREHEPAVQGDPLNLMLRSILFTCSQVTPLRYPV
jgi:hypothetical protein